MKSLAFFVANYAETQSSLVYAQGGFPEWWTVAEMPTDQNLALVLSLELDAEDLNRRLILDITATRPSQPGVSFSVAQIQLERPKDSNHPDGAPYQQNIAINLGLAMDTTGRYEFIVINAGQELIRTSLAVRLIVPSD